MDRLIASESVAERFTRVMNATPARVGQFADLAGAGVLSAAIVTVGFFVARDAHGTGPVYAVLALAAVPLLISGAVAWALRGSREVVVTWLAGLPFPVENLNTLLAGLGDTLEVYFEPGERRPERSELQPLLDRVSEDALMVNERPDENVVEIRLGVIDSKRFPLRTNHQRWLRLLAVVDQALVPLAKSAPIAKIYVV